MKRKREREIRQRKREGEEKNNVSHRENEESRISPRGGRTTYLGARTKNDLSRHDDAK